MLTLPFVTARGDNAPVVSDVMQRVLAGEPDAARAALEGLRGSASDSLLDQLAIELQDLERGGYATEGNRSFPELAPLWQQARVQWLTSQPQPTGALPDEIVALPAAVPRVLLVDTRHSAAWLLERDARGQWPAVDGFYISVGANGVDKRRRGDRRTPVGVYYPIDALDAALLPPRYGSHVLPLDYPNALDTHQGRSGDGIWLHGIDPDNNIRPPRDTDGCIAFDNARIGALSALLVLHATPVVVADGFDWERDETLEETAEALRRALGLWRSTQLDGDANGLFSLYVDDYARFGLSPELWRAGQRARLDGALLSDIGIEDLEIFEADEGVYLTRFRQVLRGEGMSPITTMRRLYWRRIEGEWKVIAEQNG